MKKGLAAAAIVISAAVLAMIVAGVFLLTGSGDKKKDVKPLETYLAEDWASYTFDGYDDGVLLLSYPISVTYAQAETYGAAAYGDLVQGHVETLKLMRAGILTNCEEQPTRLIVRGMTTDGQIAYTVSSDGTTETCWNTP